MWLTSLFRCFGRGGNVARLKCGFSRQPRRRSARPRLLEQLEDRLTPSAGALDPTFGVGGKVTTDFAGIFDVAMALQADGKIVVVGDSVVGGFGDFALARYNADGTLDDSFGTSGKVTTDFGGDEDRAFDVAIQANGRIVVVGHSVAGDAVDFALARYNADGSLDDGGPNDSTPADTFGTSGKVTTDFGGTIDLATSVVLQADGKIVVAGSTFGGGSEDFALARYNADGTLDDGFGTSGKVTTDFGGSDRATSVALQTDGKIVVAGSTFGGGFGGLALARYLGDPTPQEQIEDLGEDIDDLVTGGALTSGHGNALKAKLEAALDKIARGQINAAVNQLGAFIRQVESYVAAGILSDDEADNLLDAATALLASLTT
jgi:uncharacterized delta-60 repeat protein